MFDYYSSYEFIILVVHVAFLKKDFPTNTIAHPDLPPQCVLIDANHLRLQVLNTKNIASGDTILHLV